ncbi:hypothetical protein VNO80_20073 [Phaseolus coccineus]|uniref:Uncharacterized protein n=1 Tax=Phaseolus coccineus TaxID=3886 RepID=A0AAN9MNH5_PHACN
MIINGLFVSQHFLFPQKSAIYNETQETKIQYKETSYDSKHNLLLANLCYRRTNYSITVKCKTVTEVESKE